MSTHHHADATEIYSHKHHCSEINRDLSASERSTKKFRLEDVRTMEPQIPAYSIGNIYNDTLLHTRVMRMCQDDLLAMKAVNNQELFSPHGSIFLQTTAFSMWQPEQQVKSVLERNATLVGHADIHRLNDGSSMARNLDVRRAPTILDINTPPVMQSQAMTTFLPKSANIECSSNKNRGTSHDLTTALNHIASVDYLHNVSVNPRKMSDSSAAASLECGIPSKLPFCMAQPADKFKLSEHQLFLRFQIEAFAATEDDVNTHIRGRNKRIALGQVGIRCRHCAHLSASRRQKGAAYFPANTMGLYQAAQNMCTAHIQCGLCPEMPEYIKEHFKGLIATKSFTSGAGRPYWAKSAKQMGLVNTEDGIRFIGDLPDGIEIVDDCEFKK